jgi:opacity protein-like surface antigen
MKKTTVALVCVFMSILSAHAQIDIENPKDKKVKFGFRTGYEFQANDSDLEYNLNVPYIGVFTDIRLGEKWSLQLELNLRSEERERVFNSDLRVVIDELYITVPVLFKYHFDDNFKIYSGTQLLSVSLVNDISGLKKWNGILGAEYDLTTHFFIDARFRHGFEDRSDDNNFRDNRISIGIGYKF